MGFTSGKTDLSMRVSLWPTMLRAGANFFGLMEAIIMEMWKQEKDKVLASITAQLISRATKAFGKMDLKREKVCSLFRTEQSMMVNFLKV